MNNKQAIIDKILADACETATANVDRAEQTSRQIVEQAQQQAEQYRSEHAQDATQAADEQILRRRTVDRLDVRKHTLQVKKQLLDELYARVPEVMRTQYKKEYLQLLQSRIAAVAEDGDSVVICEQDKKILTAKWVKEVSAACGKKLTLSKTLGNFDGGVILTNAVCDKNLTLSLELSQLRETTESELETVLFGEKA